MSRSNFDTRLYNEFQQPVITVYSNQAELEKSKDHIALILKRPITPSNLECTYCKLETKCK